MEAKKNMIYDHDEWLEPYKEVIDRRHEMIMDLKERMSVDGSLARGMNNHVFYGLHRDTKGNWVFREWAPNANKLHNCIDPNGVGSMLRTKINVNLGVSRDCKDYDIEMQKVMAAVGMGAEAIMDLSSHGNTQPFRQKLTAECPAMIGTVPVKLLKGPSRIRTVSPTA